MTCRSSLLSGRRPDCGDSDPHQGGLGTRQPALAGLWRAWKAVQAAGSLDMPRWTRTLGSLQGAVLSEGLLRPVGTETDPTWHIGAQHPPGAGRWPSLAWQWELAGPRQGTWAAAPPPGAVTAPQAACSVLPAVCGGQMGTHGCGYQRTLRCTPAPGPRSPQRGSKGDAEAQEAEDMRDQGT